MDKGKLVFRGIYRFMRKVCKRKLGKNLGRADFHADSRTVLLNLWVIGPFQRACLRPSELTDIYITVYNNYEVVTDNFMLGIITT